ncbi:iron complex transport system permease protein [Pseudoroseicyclus aestuarii]|uniref:Iron complex transport system permease protein n=2 Tax=Pseudoroseicyclus aestuarii TaxID=1795041 RepID=A0A318SSI2_9RHOB|nr:iron complex transport system permease protein [Pseudoroseicyclus aestuarii]
MAGPSRAITPLTRDAAILTALTLLLALTAMLCCGLGPVSIPPGTVLRVLGHHLLDWPVQGDWPASTDAIVWLSRLPRVLMAIAVGATLALAGAALQAVVRNPLADPYVLGVSAGASTGAALAILVFSGTGILLLSTSAFAGAVLAMLLVLVIGGARGEVVPFRLIMAGLAVGYALTSATSFLIFASDSPEASRSVMFWLLGSLASVHWITAQVALAVAAVTLVFMAFASGPLDALAAGDETALAVGLRPGAARLALMVGTSLAVGVMVAGSGGIGFVGLVVPHMARALTGARHAILLPTCALLGAIVLLLADLLARMLFAPQEMPIGVVTGLIGAPLLLLLLRNAAPRP